MQTNSYRLRVIDLQENEILILFGHHPEASLIQCGQLFTCMVNFNTAAMIVNYPILLSWSPLQP